MLERGSRLEATRLSRKSRDPSKRCKRIGWLPGRWLPRNFAWRWCTSGPSPPAYDLGHGGPV